MFAIKTVGLCKRYGSISSVDDLNLEISQGEFFSLLGLNGAGKTTAIKLLTGLTRISSGEAFVGGFSVCGQPLKIKDVIGVSPQKTAVAPNLSVEENLEFMCGVYGFSKKRACIKIAEVSERLSLGEVMKRRAGKLSGGMQRRLSIAMALIGEPRILFLDEPTLGLDVIARRELWDTIRALKGKATVVLTTHYMEEAEALSDRIGIMKNGRLLAVGTAGELINSTGVGRFEDAFVSIVEGGLLAPGCEMGAGRVGLNGIKATNVSLEIGKADNNGENEIYCTDKLAEKDVGDSPSAFREDNSGGYNI